MDNQTNKQKTTSLIALFFIFLSFCMTFWISMEKKGFDEMVGPIYMQFYLFLYVIYWIFRYIRILPYEDIPEVGYEDTKFVIFLFVVVYLLLMVFNFILTFEINIPFYENKIICIIGLALCVLSFHTIVHIIAFKDDFGPSAVMRFFICIFCLINLLVISIYAFWMWSYGGKFDNEFFTETVAGGIAAGIAYIYKVIKAKKNENNEELS